MFCVLCQAVKAEAGVRIPGRLDLVCRQCFTRNVGKFAGAAFNSKQLPNAQEMLAQSRLRAKARAAEQAQRLSDLQAFAQNQAQAELAGIKTQSQGELLNRLDGVRNNLAGRIDSISDGTSNTVKSIVDGTSNTVKSIIDGTSNRAGSAIQGINKLRNRF